MQQIYGLSLVSPIKKMAKITNANITDFTIEQPDKFIKTKISSKKNKNSNSVIMSQFKAIS